MVFLLLKLELLTDAERVDVAELYNGKTCKFLGAQPLTTAVLLRMIRIIVLNETNFRTYMPCDPQTNSDHADSA